jgi:hypothetical protein
MTGRCEKTGRKVSASTGLVTQVNARTPAESNAGAMPTAPEILDSLALVANRWWPLAALWHAALLALVIALLRGWRPRNGVIVALLAAPLASVAALALAGGNGFNGGIFAALALAALVAASRVQGPVRAAAPGFAPVSAGLLAFAWFYPHFLESRPWLYLFAAPMGLVPCPTLAAVAGCSILCNGAGSRSWSLLVATAALFYGLFGMLRLGVWLDAGLLLAAAALLTLGARRST